MKSVICEKGKLCLFLEITDTRIEGNYLGGLTVRNYYCNNNKKFKGGGKYLNRLDKYKMCEFKQTNKLGDFE